MASHTGTGLIVGIDIGGTFTDLIAFDERTHALYAHKELTTPEEPNRAVAAGMRKLFTSNALDIATVKRVVHATTLFSNALIERRGAQVGLITTEGFRDTIEIARERNIAIREDGDLMRVLKTIEPGHYIPEELYAAVAEILGWIYRANASYPGRR